MINLGKIGHLITAGDPHSAIFYGDLDITALGGAGFASQRTADQLSWDLAEYQGLIIRAKAGDNKKYTLVIKDYALPKRPDGRESSTISWEYSFEGSGAEFAIPWHEFSPKYRGKPKPDAEPLNLKNILRISIMCRRFVITSQWSVVFVYPSLEANFGTTVSSVSKKGLSDLSFSISPPSRLGTPHNHPFGNH